MQQVTIAGQAFDVAGLSEEDHATYRAYCVLLARHADRPIERFIRSQCVNLTREERQDALTAWLQLPGWDDPPEELVLEWARHPKAVAALARRVLLPKKSGKEWEELIGTAAESVYTLLCNALRTLTNADDDEIPRHIQAPPPPPRLQRPPAPPPARNV